MEHGNYVEKPRFREGEKVWYCGYGVEGVGKIKEILWNDREEPWEYRIEDTPFTIPEKLVRPEALFNEKMRAARRKMIEDEFGLILKEIADSAADD